MKSVATILRQRPAAVSGILLLLSTIAALGWSNSAAGDSYQAFWQTKVGIGAAGAGLEKPLLLWVNDALMAVFFLLVGLEIKREVFAGALSTARSAALPVAAALGGVLVPAGIYLLINQAQGGDSAGWAVPAATDIAFVLGILALLGSRVPLPLKIFLTTVAVVDDLAAVVIIALFFTPSLAGGALALAGLFTAVLVGLNLGGVRRSLPYVLVGILLWLAVLKSGLHPTLAGVLLASLIPIRASVSNDSESPVVRWEHALQPFVLFFVVPVFALANAGVELGGGAKSELGPIGLGIAFGLFLGKPLGLTLFAWLAVRSRVAELPRGLSWSHLHAGAWLGGIGFTMSLFIAGLAVTGPAQEAARLGLLLGSGFAAVVGSVLVWRAGSESEVRSERRRIVAGSVLRGES